MRRTPLQGCSGRTVSRAGLRSDTAERPGQTKNSYAVLGFSLAGALLVGGCSAPQVLADFGRGSLVLPVRLVDSNGHEISVAGQMYGRAVLGSIPGTIFGNPQAPFISVPIEVDQSFPVDLGRLRSLSEQATKINELGLAIGGKIVPADTRFIRVATDFEYIGSPTTAHRIGFLDLATNDPLLLVFFDRPCHLTGIADLPPRPEGEISRYVFDVTIDQAGFNWLAMHNDKVPGTAVVRHAAASVRPVYLVTY